MKTRLLITFVFTLFCTALIDVADKGCTKQTDISEIVPDCVSAHEISAPDQKLDIPRQTNFASRPQTKTLSKRDNAKRLLSRYSCYVSGKPVNKNFIETYQLTFNHFSSGLLTPYRHFLSIGRLII